MVFKHFPLRECSKTAISLKRKAILRVYNTVSTAEYQIKLVFFIKSFVLSPSAGWHCFSLESFVLRCNPLWPFAGVMMTNQMGTGARERNRKKTFFWLNGNWDVESHGKLGPAIMTANQCVEKFFFGRKLA